MVQRITVALQISWEKCQWLDWYLSLSNSTHPELATLNRAAGGPVVFVGRLGEDPRVIAGNRGDCRNVNCRDGQHKTLRPAIAGEPVAMVNECWCPLQEQL